MFSSIQKLGIIAVRIVKTGNTPAAPIRGILDQEIRFNRENSPEFSAFWDKPGIVIRELSWHKRPAKIL